MIHGMNDAVYRPYLHRPSIQLQSALRRSYRIQSSGCCLQGCVDIGPCRRSRTGRAHRQESRSLFCDRGCAPCSYELNASASYLHGRMATGDAQCPQALREHLHELRPASKPLPQDAYESGLRVREIKIEIAWCNRVWLVSAGQLARNHDAILFNALGVELTCNPQYVSASLGTMKRCKGQKQQTTFRDGKRIVGVVCGEARTVRNICFNPQRQESPTV